MHSHVMHYAMAAIGLSVFIFISALGLIAAARGAHKGE